MILQSLAHLAEREGLLECPDYETKEVHWVLGLAPDGRFLSLETLLQPPAGGKKGRSRGPEIAIPRPLPGGKRTGIAPDPAFLVDNPAFALGIDLTPEQKLVAREGELERRLGGFRDLIEAAAAVTGDPGLQAVAAFLTDEDELERARAEVRARLEAKELASNHLLVFQTEPAEVYVHQAPAVMGYWGELRAVGGSDAEERQCLITGKLAPPVDKHPPIKKIPGGSPQGVAIVSFNSSAFESYGFERNANAPVSRAAAEAYTSALNRLLNPDFPDPRQPGVRLPEQRVKLSDDTVAVIWSDEPSAVPAAIVPAVAEGDPDAAQALGITLSLGEGFDELLSELANEPAPAPSAEPLRAAICSPWTGITPSELENEGLLRTMILSGGQGRATVRACHTSTIHAAVTSMQAWFAGIDIVGFRGKPALWRLLRALAVRGETKRLDPNLAGDVFLAILSGRALPRSVLEAAVRRCRSESDSSGAGSARKRHLKVRPERVALIKACLNRSREDLCAGEGIRFQEVKPTMNDDERNTGYLLGRMFACIERMQEIALGDVNATVTDRYFAAACATPQAAFPRLLKMEVHHFRKAKEGHAGRTAGYLHWQISRIAALFVGTQSGMQDGEKIEEYLKRTAGKTIVGFPPFLPLAEQGLFTLGYHHQRADFFRKRSTDKPDDASPESDADETADVAS